MQGLAVLQWQGVVLGFQALSQWQGWSDCTVVPAAGSWAQHQPAQKRVPNRPHTPQMQASQVKPEVGSITAVSSEAAGEAEGARGTGPRSLWHTCPFCPQSRGSGAREERPLRWWRFQGSESTEAGRKVGRKETDRGRASVLPPSVPGSQATEEICFWSSCWHILSHMRLQALLELTVVLGHEGGRRCSRRRRPPPS